LKQGSPSTRDKHYVDLHVGVDDYLSARGWKLLKREFCEDVREIFVVQAKLRVGNQEEDLIGEVIGSHCRTENL